MFCHILFSQRSCEASRREIGPHFGLNSLLGHRIFVGAEEDMNLCVSVLWAYLCMPRLYFILIISFYMAALGAKFYDSENKTMGFSD